MTDLTAYSEGQLAGWMVDGQATDAAPTDVYVALHTSDPGNDPDGSTEVGAGDYDRVTTTAGTDWNVLAGDGPTQFENGVDIEFPEATSVWGTVTHVSLWNSVDSTGDAIAAYALDNSKQIEENDTARFRSGDLSFSIN